MARFHEGFWSPAHRLGNWPRPPLRILRTRSSPVWWTTVCDAADDELFKAKTFSNHVLHPLLTPPLLHLNVTICANVHIHCSYLYIQLICQTAISLYVCCTETHTRLTYPSLDLNILLILIYNIFYKLHKPAFCHAFIKRILIDWLISLQESYIRKFNNSFLLDNDNTV